MRPEEELERLLAQLQRTHDLLPFLERQLGVDEVTFRPLLDKMADVWPADPVSASDDSAVPRTFVIVLEIVAR